LENGDDGKGHCGPKGMFVRMSKDEEGDWFSGGQSLTKKNGFKRRKGCQWGGGGKTRGTTEVNEQNEKEERRSVWKKGEKNSSQEPTM